MQKFTDTILNKNSRGLLVPSVGGTATIYNGGTADLATLYEDDEIATKTNPLTADADGFVECRLANGEYDILYANNVDTRRVEGYQAFDPDDGGTTGQEVVGEIDTVVTCATAWPFDNTFPQNTEGDEVVTAAITPEQSGSDIEIIYSVSGSSSTGMFVGAAVFQDSVASCLAGSSAMGQTTGPDQKFHIEKTFRIAAGSTSSRTYKLRVGPSTGTAYVNGDSSGTRIFNGKMKAIITLREVL